MAKDRLSDPHFIKNFAQQTLGISDPDKVKAIQRLCADFCDTNFARVIVNPDSAFDEPDLMMVVGLGGYDNTPENVYGVVNNSDGRIILRRQKLHNDKLRGMSDLEIGTLVQSPNFVWSDDGRDQGGYLNRSANSLREENIFKHLKDIQSSASYHMSKRLVAEIAKIAEMWDEEYDTFSDFDADYEKFDPIRQAATPFVERDIRSKFKELTTHLDPDIMQTLIRARLPVNFLYSWLAGKQESYDDDRLPVASDEIKKRRLKAAWTFPVLICEMAYNDDLTEAIDRGGSLIDTVQKYARDRHFPSDDNITITRECIKWLRGKNQYLVDGTCGGINPNIYHILGHLEGLSVIPPEWRPRNAVEWDAYKILTLNLGKFARAIGRSRQDLFREVMTAFSRPNGLPIHTIFPRPDEQGNEAEGPPRIKAMFESTRPIQDMVVKNYRNIDMSSNINDFIQRMGSQIILPELYDRMIRHGVDIDTIFEKDRKWHDCKPGQDGLMGELSRCMLRDVGVIKLISSSYRWHRQAAHLENRTGYLDRDMKWHPLISPVIGPEGVKIRALSSTAELINMGNEMNNCVGGYTYNCAVGNSHILVLEAADGQWKTNMELKDYNSRDGRTVNIVQHEMSGNRKKVPYEAERAAEWLTQGINNGCITVNWDIIETNRREFEKDEMLLKIGFDPLSFEARERAYTAWHGTMPNLLREPDRMTYLCSIGADDLMDKIISDLKNGTKTIAYYRPEM